MTSLQIPLRPGPTAEEVLSDPAASMWLQMALKGALLRDPVDSANDAAVLAAVLNERVEACLRDAQSATAPTQDRARHADAAFPGGMD